ncbi:MAG: DNA-binding protein [Methylohalobius sp.]|nr:DNA-binding protein [Methylohalobius sp.]
MHKNGPVARGSTRELAFAACDEIFLTQARFPTVDLVTQAIGINNRRLVSEVIQEWRKDLSARFQKDRLEVPEAIRKLWFSALEVAKSQLESERLALEQERSHMAKERQEFKQALLEATREMETLKARLSEKACRIEQLEAELARLHQALEDRQQELIQVGETAARLQGQLEEARAALEKAEKRVEGTMQWANLRIEEERTRIGKEWQHRLTQLEGEAAQERLWRQTAEARLKHAEDRLDQVLSQLAQKDQALSILRQEKEDWLKERHNLHETIQCLERRLNSYQTRRRLK